MPPIVMLIFFLSFVTAGPTLPPESRSTINSFEGLDWDRETGIQDVDWSRIFNASRKHKYAGGFRYVNLKIFRHTHFPGAIECKHITFNCRPC